MAKVEAVSRSDAIEWLCGVGIDEYWVSSLSPKDLHSLYGCERQSVQYPDSLFAKYWIEESKDLLKMLRSDPTSLERGWTKYRSERISRKLDSLPFDQVYGAWTEIERVLPLMDPRHVPVQMKHFTQGCWTPGHFVRLREVLRIVVDRETAFLLFDLLEKVGQNNVGVMVGTAVLFFDDMEHTSISDIEGWITNRVPAEWVLAHLEVQ